MNENEQFTNLASSADGFEFDDDRVTFPSIEQQQLPLGAHGFASFYSLNSEVDFSGRHHEDYPILNYINRVLMEEEEENMDEHSGIFHDPMALRATEKSLYEVLGKDCPPSSSSDQPLPQLQRRTHIPTDTAWSENQSILDPRIQRSSFLSDSDALLLFKKGLEEGNKFLPAGNQLIVGLDQYALPSEEPMATYGKKDEGKEHWNSSSKGKKQQDRGSGDEIEAGRSNKEHAFSSNEVELAETFEKMLVFFEDFEEPCFAIDSEDPTGSLQQPGGSVAKKATETGADLDLTALLISSAQCVAAGDHKSANEKLKLIRLYSSSTGNAPQRLAIPFANALEARLAGMEPDFYGSKTSKVTSAAEELKAFRVYLCAPFRQISAFFTNKMILEASSEAEKIHIIDFGIGYGFHWPGLIDQLCSRPGGGGPPKLRITGIDIPQPGFRPAERIQQTGQRLAKYCERRNVPFDYQAIAIRNWHRIRVEELKLEEDEWVAVNCQFRLRCLLEDKDAAVGEDDSKDAVLKIIREMKPDICLTEVISAQFGGPFFLGRFREALYFFSTLFDLLEHNLPREDKSRIKYEGFLGHAVMNVVACEGSTRVERPETFKQWEIRYKHAGFRALPLNHDMVKELRNIVKEGYHPDFMFDEDGCWILEGWKGKTITAVSCWAPVQESSV